MPLACLPMGRGKLRIRRLTLAEGLREAEVETDEEDGDDESSLNLAKERLARITELAVVSTPASRARSLHGVEDRLGYRFWARSDSDSDDGEEEGQDVQDLNTPEFIRSVKAVGFSTPEITRALAEIRVAPSTQRPFAPEGSMAKFIVQTMANQRRSCTPWKGALPPKRVSPRQTIGDAIAKAKVITSSPSPKSFSVSSLDRCRSPSVAGRSSVRSSFLGSSMIQISNHQKCSGANCGPSERKAFGPLDQQEVMFPNPIVPYRPTQGLVALFANSSAFGRVVNPRAPHTRSSSYAAISHAATSYTDITRRPMENGGNNNPARNQRDGASGGRSFGQGGFVGRGGFQATNNGFHPGYAGRGTYTGRGGGRYTRGRPGGRQTGGRGPNRGGFGGRHGWGPQAGDNYADHQPAQQPAQLPVQQPAQVQQ